MDPQCFASAASVVVIRGAGFNAKRRGDTDRLAVEKDAEQIESLAHILCDVVPGSEAAWMEWPAMSFVFLADGEVLGEVGLLSRGQWARHVEGDFEIRDPADLKLWLHAHGVPLS